MRRRPGLRAVALCALVALVALVGGCGDDESETADEPQGLADDAVCPLTVDDASRALDRTLEVFLEEPGRCIYILPGLSDGSPEAVGVSLIRAESTAAEVRADADAFEAGDDTATVTDRPALGESAFEFSNDDPATGPLVSFTLPASDGTSSWTLAAEAGSSWELDTLQAGMRELAGQLHERL